MCFVCFGRGISRVAGERVQERVNLFVRHVPEALLVPYKSGYTRNIAMRYICRQTSCGRLSYGRGLRGMTQRGQRPPPHPHPPPFPPSRQSTTSSANIAAATTSRAPGGAVWSLVSILPLAACLARDGTRPGPRRTRAHTPAQPTSRWLGSAIHLRLDTLRLGLDVLACFAAGTDATVAKGQDAAS